MAKESTRRGLSEGKLARAQQDSLLREIEGSQVAPDNSDDFDHQGIPENERSPAAGDGVGEQGRPNAEPTRHVVGKIMRVVEVTDLFRTMKGLKCTLTEAYACCFDRMEKVRPPLKRLGFGSWFVTMS